MSSTCFNDDTRNCFSMPKDSTVPGLVYLSTREDLDRTPMNFIKGRREVDGAEGLWRIRNSLYDLGAFVKLHPGGAEWLQITKGIDITELFEVYHQNF